MPSWWKSSSKDAKKKPSKESFIDALQRKFKIPSENKSSSKSGVSRRRCSDTISERGSQSRAESRATSPSKEVARCQSFVERPLALPLPPPGLHHPTSMGRADSGASLSPKPKNDKIKPSLLMPLPKPRCIRSKKDPSDAEVDFVAASISSECSIDSDDPVDSHQRSPLTSDCETGRTAAGSPSSGMAKDRSLVTEMKSKEIAIQQNQVSPLSPKGRLSRNAVPNIQVPGHGTLFSAPDSSMSSPSRSPIRVFGTDQVLNSTFWNGKHYRDLPLLGSGHCSSPGSGHNSGHNSVGGDMSGQFLWQPTRGSAEHSPIPSPRLTSPGPGSRIHSGAVTPLHPRAGGAVNEEGKQQNHRLPLPPISIMNTSPFSHSNSAATSPSVPRSPGRAENPTSPCSRWKKGKLLGRGTFGHVYVGFNSETGEMCAMKEVTLFADDAKSKESAKQLGQEITLLSRLRHPNIVQYYGSESVGDKLYIYLEYVSGGSIYKLLQDYGQLGESAIRSYTKQILSGLAFLHAKSTVHRDIKGANILVDPNGRVKLADFGMAKHITGQSCPLSFKGSPYWMAPEVIKNANGASLAVDIWSLGCTVLEMATTKPPWSQYEGVAAMFKIGNSKELPLIPDHLSDEGKDFVRQCLQRDPQDRLTAAQLLDHSFVRSAAPLEKPIVGLEISDPRIGVKTEEKSAGAGRGKHVLTLDSERHGTHSSRTIKSGLHSSNIIHMQKNISCPVSPIGSPLLYPRSPQNMNGRMSPSPISSPCTMSGSSTPLTGGGGSSARSFHQLNQSVYLQEGFGNINLIKPPQHSYMNDPIHRSQTHDFFRGAQPPHGSQFGTEQQPLSREIETTTSGRSTIIIRGEQQQQQHQQPYDRQSALADRVSQQLLRDHVKSFQSLDLGMSSPLRNT
ncbi:mitogen-activated protein kinase kinase kinase YODA [Impatiens glandulifera]|uniref:mitogen-activated protein kinase kinase kinase YODA n=1 Tax=Impatiens glandulifera TaxID=253017 RepID=UPI001FB16830|nr:mitogen-activated protein kinase kinase kinase YODA [Impatiens glandulifera]XP_047321812.1 mitogen-activated protein kinase kinase kinase YODA [Impatiens glandulifera]